MSDSRRLRTVGPPYGPSVSFGRPAEDSRKTASGRVPRLPRTTWRPAQEDKKEQNMDAQISLCVGRDARDRQPVACHGAGR
jgi:hypothetical protein